MSRSVWVSKWCGCKSGTIFLGTCKLKNVWTLIGISMSALGTNTTKHKKNTQQKSIFNYSQMPPLIVRHIVINKLARRTTHQIIKYDYNLNLPLTGLVWCLSKFRNLNPDRSVKMFIALRTTWQNTGYYQNQLIVY